MRFSLFSPFSRWASAPADHTGRPCIVGRVGGDPLPDLILELYQLASGNVPYFKIKGKMVAFKLKQAEILDLLVLICTCWYQMGPV